MIRLGSCGHLINTLVEQHGWIGHRRTAWVDEGPYVALVQSRAMLYSGITIGVCSRRLMQSYLDWLKFWLLVNSSLDWLKFFDWCTVLSIGWRIWWLVEFSRLVEESDVWLSSLHGHQEAASKVGHAQKSVLYIKKSEHTINDIRTWTLHWQKILREVYWIPLLRTLSYNLRVWFPSSSNQRELL